MTIIRRLFSSHIIRLLVMIAIVYYTLCGIPDAYGIFLQEIIVEETESSNQLLLTARGGNMYRPNSFYLDGKRIENAIVEKSTYEQCFIHIDKDVFQQGKWHRMEVGFSKWGILNLLSTPIWLEWIY